MIRVRRRFPGLMRWVVIPVIMVGLLTQAAPNARAEDPQGQIDQAQSDLERIQRDKEQAKNDLAQAHFRAQEAAAQLRKAESEKALADSQLAVITNQRVTAEADLKKLDAEVGAAQKRYDERKALLARRIRAINEDGRISYLAVLLGSNSFGDFISRFDMLKLVVKKDSELFDQVRQDKVVLEGRKELAQVRRDRLVQLHEQEQVRQVALVAKRDEAIQLSRSVESSKRSLQSRLDEFDRMEAAAREQIAQLMAKSTRGAGRFSPLPPVANALVTDVFGPRMHPILGTWRPHNGTDYNARAGEAVYAIESGVVIVARWDDAYGNLIVIDHGGGIFSWYGHSSRLLVKVGDSVNQRQRIADAGTTGWSTGPHVHLEIHVNGKPVDPQKYIK